PARTFLSPCVTSGLMGVSAGELGRGRRFTAELARTRPRARSLVTAAGYGRPVDDPWLMLDRRRAPSASAAEAIGVPVAALRRGHRAGIAHPAAASPGGRLWWDVDDLRRHLQDVGSPLASCGTPAAYKRHLKRG